MSSHDHDLPFLTYVHSVLDKDPRGDVTARQTADAIGINADEAEQVQARLLRDGHLVKRNAAARLAAGILDARLDVTSSGAHAANTQRL